MGFYTFIIKKTQPTFGGIIFWIFSNFFIAFGYLFIALRGLIPNFISIVLAQFLFITAGLIRIYGLNKFFEKKQPKWLHYLTSVLIPVSTAIFLYFTYTDNNIYARTIFSGLFLAGLSVLTGILILNNNPSASRFAYNFLAITFFIFALIFMFRILIWTFVPEVRGVFAANFINELQFIASMLIDISWTTIFFVIHNQKLTFRLQESEEKFRAIFEHNSSALAVVDFDSTITMVNDEYCKIGGYSKDEVIGKSWTTQIPSEDLPRLLEYNRNRINNPANAPDKYEFTLKHKNGEIIHALMSVSQIPDLKIIIASFTNITERKKSEEQLLQLTSELKILNSNKDLFLSIIAHDLRNPFSLLINLSDILLYNIQISNTSESERIAVSLNNAAKSAYYLLENLLVWARSQDGRLPFSPEYHSLEEICCEVIHNIKESAKEKKIKISLSSINIKVFSDRSMFTLILRNLLSNAIKFSNNESEIFISAEHSENFNTIIVRDNGIGIKPQNIEKLWTIAEKFSTTGTANETGSGLGLILCKEFVEKHCGKIWVESEYGKGSSFKFTLPIKN